MKNIRPQNLLEKLITMSKTIYFLNQKYTCSENGKISTHHIRNRIPIGKVLLGREQIRAHICLCGCRIYNCTDRLFTTRIDGEEIDGRVICYTLPGCHYSTYEADGLKRMIERCPNNEAGFFYGCTKTFEQLK